MGSVLAYFTPVALCPAAPHRRLPNRLAPMRRLNSLGDDRERFWRGVVRLRSVVAADRAPRRSASRVARDRILASPCDPSVAAITR